MSSKEMLLSAVRGRTGWIISDGKAGHEGQCRGVFEAMGLAYEVKRIRPGRLQQMLAPYAPVARAEHFGEFELEHNLHREPYKNPGRVAVQNRLC